MASGDSHPLVCAVRSRVSEEPLETEHMTDFGVWPSVSDGIGEVMWLGGPESAEETFLEARWLARRPRVPSTVTCNASCSFFPDPIFLSAHNLLRLANQHPYQVTH